jgi:EAL domain-containing protein (putative c-di-GMP-specific phosphodiesterase class I)
LAFLVERGCEIGQGYFFSRPVPALEAEAMLPEAPSA